MGIFGVGREEAERKWAMEWVCCLPTYPHSQTGGRRLYQLYITALRAGDRERRTGWKTAKAAGVETDMPPARRGVECRRDKNKETYANLPLPL